MRIDDARARFPGLRAGYESFYLRACSPEGGRGIWIRYTVAKRPGERPTGALWFTYFDSTRPGPVAVKAIMLDPKLGRHYWIGIDDARIGPRAAEGRIRNGDSDEVTWNLRFAGAPTLRHLPGSWTYRMPLPRTKSLSLHPAAQFDGTVRVDGQDIRVDGWHGMVGHNWGTQHAERWIWLHGTNFGEYGEDTWLDVVIGRIRLAGHTLPWIASGAISVAGRRKHLGGPLRLRNMRVDERPDRLDFTIPGRGISVSGHVAADRDRFVGWVYADPDGSEHHTVNSSIADMTVNVTGSAVGAHLLRSVGTAAYELGMREHDHGVLLQPYPDT